MRAWLIRHLEAVTLVAGVLLLCLALAAYDPRLGLGLLGLVLVMASVDWAGLRSRT